MYQMAQLWLAASSAEEAAGGRGCEGAGVKEVTRDYLDQQNSQSAMKCEIKVK